VILSSAKTLEGSILKIKKLIIFLIKSYLTTNLIITKYRLPEDYLQRDELFLLLKPNHHSHVLNI